jgi:cyclin-dependent kinase
MSKSTALTIAKTPEEKINNLQTIERVGEGTYGVVYRSRNKETNEIVAVKKCRSNEEDEGIASTTIREIIALKALKHPNITNIHDVIIHMDKIHIVMEYKPQDLKKYMEQTIGKINPTIYKHIFYQLLLGITYLHKAHFIHRDIKPANILIDTSDCKKDIPVQVQIADLGLSRMIPLNNFGCKDQTFTHEVCTLWYRPPEILLGARHYSQNIDIFSLGVTFVEVITKSHFLPGDSEVDQLFRIFRTFGTPTAENKIWPGALLLPDYKPTFPVWKPKKIRDTFIMPEQSAIQEQDYKSDGISDSTTCHKCKRKSNSEISITLEKGVYWCVDCWKGRNVLLDSLLSHMLCLDPERRFNSLQCLRHPYFNDIRHLYAY